MQARVAVVTINMLKCIDEEPETVSDCEEILGWEAYYRKHPSQNIDLLVSRLHHICENLLVREPQAKWLITWPEHGLGRDGGWLNSEAKTYFKEKMKALTSEYKQLAVIAGSILTGRTFKLDSADQYRRKCKVVENAFEENKWVDTIEDNDDFSLQYRAHYQQVLINQIIDKDNPKTILRNTSYLFINGECIGRHDKISPFEETKPFATSNMFFQPGKGRNFNSYSVLKYADGVRISVGIEICREHGLGILKRQLEEKRLPGPLIHIVMSDSCDTYDKNITGRYFFHADTFRIAQARSMAEHNPEYQVVHYRHVFFRSQQSLEGPLSLDSIQKRPACK